MNDQKYPRCTHTLRAAGGYYPRSCEECGLGPCKAERATVAPAESVDTPEFDKLLRHFYTTAYAFAGNTPNPHTLAELVAHINAWGARRYEAGRQEHFKLILEWQKLYGGINEELQAMKDRAERAEAALASRPAVDLSQLQRYDFSSFGGCYPSDDCGEWYKRADVHALLSGKVEAPTVKESLPVQAPTASADGLRPLPQHHTHEEYPWCIEYYTATQMHTYARQARADALEEAAKHVELYPAANTLGEAFCKNLASAIRALNKKG